MIIIRIVQAKSIAHTEFKLMSDYRPVPRVNFEVAKDWASKGLLEPFDASVVQLIENMQNYFIALRSLETRYAEITNRDVDEYVSRLESRGHTPEVDAIVCR